MVNVKEKAKNVITTVKRKAIPVAVSAATALSTVCVTAFATEGDPSTTTMYQTIADSFKTGVTNMADGIALVLAAIVPIGVGIVGLMSAIGAGKKILNKLSN